MSAEKMPDAQRIAWLEEQLAKANERLDRVDPKPRVIEPVPVDNYLKRALTLTKNDGEYNVEVATDLFIRWTETHSEVRDALKPLVREALERRLEALATTPASA